jgi:hypothetical protein
LASGAAKRESGAMKKSLIALTVLLVLAVPAGIALLSVALDRTKVRTHTVSAPIREIVVNAHDGDVELVSGGAVVAVRETQHYVKTQPQLHQDIADGVLTLDSHCSGAFWQTCYADLRVGVPAGVKVTVDADSGDVQAHGVDVPDAQLRTDSGNVAVRLAGTQQRVWARSGSGDVHVASADARSVDAQTDSGNVTVDVRSNLGSVSAQSDSGGVDVAVPAGDYAVQAGSDSGRVDVDGLVRDDRAPRSILARTDSGDVTLRGR